MATSKPSLTDSIEAMQAVATFFDELNHNIEPGNMAAGDDAIPFAIKAGLAIPDALEGFSIACATGVHRLTKNDLARTVVLELQPRTVTTARARTFRQCFDVKKGPITLKVCVNCSLKWTSISCTITITITASL